MLEAFLAAGGPCCGAVALETLFSGLRSLGCDLDLEKLRPILDPWDRGALCALDFFVVEEGGEDGEGRGDGPAARRRALERRWRGLAGSGASHVKSGLSEAPALLERWAKRWTQANWAADGDACKRGNAKSVSLLKPLRAAHIPTSSLSAPRLGPDPARKHRAGQMPNTQAPAEAVARRTSTATGSTSTATAATGKEAMLPKLSVDHRSRSLRRQRETRNLYEQRQLQAVSLPVLVPQHRSQQALRPRCFRDQELFEKFERDKTFHSHPDIRSAQATTQERASFCRASRSLAQQLSPALFLLSWAVLGLPSAVTGMSATSKSSCMQGPGPNPHRLSWLARRLDRWRDKRPNENSERSLQKPCLKGMAQRCSANLFRPAF